MSINYSDLLPQYVRLVEVLQAKIARGDLAFSAPEIGTVADTGNYPVEFEPTDIERPDWEE